MDQILDREMTAVVKSVIDELNPQHQELIRLRFFVGMTQKEIGDKCGRTSGHAYQCEKSALRKLRHISRVKKLKEWLDYCNEREHSTP